MPLWPDLRAPGRRGCGTRVYSPGHGLVALKVRSDGSLEMLHRHLLQFKAWIKGPQNSFHPHLTIAFDDLDQAWTKTLTKHFSTPARKPADFGFTVDSVALYYEKPEGWTEFGSVPLG